MTTDPSTTTIRIRRQTRERLAQVAQVLRQPMTAVVDAAIEALERRLFLDAVNSGYTALKTDQEAWQRLTAERRIVENAPLGSS